MLKIHNSLTKQKEPFQSIQSGEVKMYVCGMTVYDYCHIGHGRIFVVFDMVARYFRYRHYQVTYVRNITDIDDKIIKRANENGEPIEQLTARNIIAMHEDEAALGVLSPDIVPRATEYLEEIIVMIEKLIEKGSAYVADDGDVYFAVNTFENYGELAHQDLAALMVGHRVDVTEAKRNPLDFALWKLAKPDEPSWDSPWGHGRPGWHIECSAMSAKTLGWQFDIHGGGMDLLFPHHQNEIAQSEAAHGCKMVNYWMHCGFVNVKEEKMSKSLGNFFTLREVLKQYHPEVIRYFMLASHYRSPINYSTDNLESAWQAIKRVYGSLRDIPLTNEHSVGLEQFEERFISAMDDDFNTPEAIAVLFDIVREINNLKEQAQIASAGSYAALLRRLGEVLGLFQYDPVDILRSGIANDDVSKIEALVAARNVARAQKDWAKADLLRSELSAMGVSLEDKSGETMWIKD